MPIERLFSDPNELRITPTGIGAFRLTVSPVLKEAMKGTKGEKGDRGLAGSPGPTGPAGSGGSGDLSWERFFLTMGA